jgi:hypothetical protein
MTQARFRHHIVASGVSRTTAWPEESKWTINGHLGQLPSTGGPTRHLYEMPTLGTSDREKLEASENPTLWKIHLYGSPCAFAFDASANGSVQPI